MNNLEEMLKIGKSIEKLLNHNINAVVEAEGPDEFSKAVSNLLVLRRALLEIVKEMEDHPVVKDVVQDYGKIEQAAYEEKFPNGFLVDRN